MTFLGTPVDSRHGDEEKKGAHIGKREAGAFLWKQKEKSCSLESVERVLQQSSKCAQRHYKSSSSCPCGNRDEHMKEEKEEGLACDEYQSFKG